MVAARAVQYDQAEKWVQQWFAAGSSLHDRQSALNAAASNMEQSLQLLGATAVEDSLQAGVPRALDSLRQAGIATWMLTGDKMETALQIATASRLVSPFCLQTTEFGHTASYGDRLPMLHLHAAACTPLEVLFRVRDAEKWVKSQSPGQGYALVLNGDFAHAALLDSDICAQFAALLLQADQVICCRASPQNKAQLVEMCKQKLVNSRVLAIGDGGNDVPMIQAAHVGVGLSGREGEGASRAADVSVPAFAGLLPLLLYHGRKAHRTTAFLAQFALYKSFALCLQQTLFNAFVAGISGTSVFDAISLTTFNTLFTTAPLAALAFGTDMSYVDAVNRPGAYRQSLANQWRNPATVVLWMTAAVTHGVVAWLAAAAAFVVASDPQSVISYVCFACVLLTVLFLLVVLSPVQGRALWFCTVGCGLLFLCTLICRAYFATGEMSVVAQIVLVRFSTWQGILPLAGCITFVCFLLVAPQIGASPVAGILWGVQKLYQLVTNWALQSAK
jgi:phospholipid-translocating ATPase